MELHITDLVPGDTRRRRQNSQAADCGIVIVALCCVRVVMWLSFLKTQQIHLFYWYLFSKSLILSNLCKNINLIYFFSGLQTFLHLFFYLLLEIKSILKVYTNNFSELLINLQNKKAILGSGGKSALNKSLRLEWIISIHLLAPERPTKYSK